MATVKELKATARPKSGKGAARAERRAGRVPGVIYGNNQPPVTISVDDSELRQALLRGISETGVPTIETDWVPPSKRSEISATFTKIAKPTLRERLRTARG